MENSTLSTIANLRIKAIEAESSNYGARRDYAKGLNDLCASYDFEDAWFDFENEGTKLPDFIDGEKTLYYKGLKDINYSNPSNAWKMIKKYAKENARERNLFGLEPEIEGESESESKGANSRKSLTLRLTDELSLLYKACHRAESLSERESECFAQIGLALKALGVNTVNLKIK